MHRWGHVICFSATGGKRRLGVSAARPAPAAAAAPAPSVDTLKARLAAEVKKMIQAGHLRTGWFNRGLDSNNLEQKVTDNFDDYFSLPGQTIEVLIRALPHLPAELQARLTGYIKAEFEAYPPDKVAHIGWQGAGREADDVPPEMLDAMAKMGPSSQASGRVHRVLWTFPPQANYALYQYARIFGGADELLKRARPIEKIPPDQVLIQYPWAHNAFIASLAGIVGLSNLAGRPDAVAKGQLERLLRLRADTFSKDRPAYRRPQGTSSVNQSLLTDQAARTHLNEHLPLTIGRNFLFLTPELATHLREHARRKVREACAEYNEVHPHWFIAKAEEGWQENTFCPLWDYHTLFQAKAMVLKEPYEELAQYLDVPAFYRGDLYYVDNLCAALDAAAR
jgi:hypothetical protein